MQTEEKRSTINERDDNGTLIFEPPHEDTLYTIAELEELLSALVGKEVPEDSRSNVGASHWVKRRVFELLGYKEIPAFRSGKATKHTPKFLHQIMDVFLQSRDNLQVWGYTADDEIVADWRTNQAYELSDTRIVIVRHEDYEIKGIRIVNGDILSEWDDTGTKTFKWQGAIPERLRDETIFTGTIDPLFVELTKDAELQPLNERVAAISRKSERVSGQLMNSPPETDLILSIDEIAERLHSLIGTTLVNRGERVTGQLFEGKVGRKLGYHIDEDQLSADTGAFPDITHQFIEAKLQDSPTIDLGAHHPGSDEIVVIADSMELTPSQARYVIGLADMGSDQFEITGLIIVSGEEFEEHIGVTEDRNSKIQMTIPNFEDIDGTSTLAQEEDKQTQLDGYDFRD